MAEMRDKVKSGIDAAADKAKTMTDRTADAAQGAHQGVQNQAGGVVDAADGARPGGTP